ncbi:nucleotidyltransferase domain-containing protein [Spirulina sp. CS-785/01]|uniref:nucleotidyltransferase family protein n=1 Tax=Spirulina sp. CS-785/01 TaxID=3021716 RepID=UPI00232AF54C|nr:nucleotidyltransferase domain-containing protein [Spirulina sp. CS-785/01]MDB9312950.1 nucleotidyltransferase domain-containing protein [Spirulina sp. CS-785/01]
MNSYRATAQQRKQQEIAQTDQRWRQAQQVAQQGAAWLREQYHVQEVILFGSAVVRDRFHLTSDIDLAVSDLPSEVFFTAVAQLQDLSPAFKVDLVRLDHCQASLRQVILTEGKPL